MRTPCQAGARDSRLWQCLRFLNRRGDCAAPARPAGNGRGRQFLPGCLPGINHNGSGFKVFGDRRRFGWGSSRCASTDRTEPRWRPRRPPRAAAPAAPSPSASRRRRAMPPRPAACARFRRVDALIALQGVEDPTRAQEARGRQGPQRARRARHAQARRCSTAASTGSTLARLKVAAEGLTEQTGDPGLDTVLGRDRPARGGRTGQGRHPLAHDPATVQN